MIKEETKSLCLPLGGNSGITAIVDDIIDAHMTNPAVNARYLPIKIELTLKNLKDMKKADYKKAFKNKAGALIEIVDYKLDEEKAVLTHPLYKRRSYQFY